jgi:F-type H+-transporting ATPase subunit delta
MVDVSDDFRRFVHSPLISADDQIKALDAIMSRAGLGDLVRNFIKLIASNRRLFAVSDIIKAYRALAARARGEVAAEVVSAHPLNDAQTAELKATLKASVGKDVTLAVKVDPSLLGGLVVRIGSRMIDSSLKTRLASMRHALKGGL